MPISEILTPERIRLGVEAASKKRALEAVSEVIASGEEEVRVQGVFEGLCVRERLGSTGIGHGVALPHARMPGLARALGAFVRLAHPVDFDAPDGEPVDLVFAMLVPDGAVEEHLAMLAQLAESFGDESVRRRLRESDDPARVVELLARAALAA